jgi:septum formation protein
MKNYNDLIIYEYIKTKEPKGKAGAYAIQGEGGKLVEKFTGDFFTIVGLPVKKIQEELKEFTY